MFWKAQCRHTNRGVRSERAYASQSGWQSQMMYFVVQFDFVIPHEKYKLKVMRILEVYEHIGVDLISPATNGKRSRT